ncbi:class I adenylate cyclase [Bowmanella dokdonensis]|uniref:Class I adenylate cyclase n=1 Tax=Bowmanella dokdonensis TaxID=751969 RepID=A0A939ISV8_9ALTE|nr:class I adenylate cyclase [Bowmanella dokdonensis]MBN7827579.1 class I adenylate cyclase [Bowmanella dokdonensis]
MSIQKDLAIRLLRVLRYNKARIERALVLLPADKQPLFHILPFLLHVNHPDLPGYVDDKDVPFGLNNYSLRKQVGESLEQVFPELRPLFADMRQIWPRRRFIDSLVLMGSIGSIAQSASSDFDYWVCVDGEKLNEKSRELLEKKLRLVEKWAEQHELEVHFFLSEIDKVRQNDFGEADNESSGSAQAVFLKAEFYTTNIVVAGKLPFWWLIPDRISDLEYQQLIGSLTPGGSPDPRLFMDLGNLQQLDPNELFGAAIWQIVKAMDSPFKSVLKMAKLEVFLENLGQKQPLCNELKNRVHAGDLAPGALEHVDPYALMFDELIDHYQAANNQSVVQLLQLCLYIKCACHLSLGKAADNENFKDKIIRSYVQSWGWSEEKIKKVDRIRHWDFMEKSVLSRQIHGFLIGCYRRLSAGIARDNQLVSQEDMTVIGRKLDTFYSKKDGKIEYLRSVFDDELYCGTITVKATPYPNGTRRWRIYAGDQISRNGKTLEKSLLQSSLSPIELIVWGVWNRILDGNTRIQLDYHTEPVVEEDLYNLVAEVEKAFPPVRVSELSREALLSPARLQTCLAVINFESRRLKAEVESITFIYRNSWGELYTLSGMESVHRLWCEWQQSRSGHPLLVIIPQGTHKQRLIENFSRRSGIDSVRVL